LGMGYNLIKGDPSNNNHDPGFAFQVIRFTWNNHEMESGHKYEIPDHIQALQSKSCNFGSEVTEVYGTAGVVRILCRSMFQSKVVALDRSGVPDFQPARVTGR